MHSPTRLAIIDLGTNSVRFDVHELQASGATRRLHREKLMIRLGQNVFLKRRLDRTAVQRAIKAFEHFAQVARRLHASRIVAFGTSALRDARDRDALIAQIRRRTGIQLRVLSGREEAHLIALGVLTLESQARALPKRFVLIDVGGGSTEVSVCRDGRSVRSESFDLGTARAQQLFLKRSPPAPRDLEQLRHYVRDTLFQVLIPDRWPKAKRAIASSGTARAVARLIHPHADSTQQRQFTLKELARLNERMSQLRSRELLALPRMEPKRVDMILAGAVILEESLRALGVQKVELTEHSLRDGIFAEERTRLARADQSLLSLREDALIAVANRFGASDTHLRSLSQATQLLFDATRTRHRIPVKLRAHLIAAALLKDTGKCVSLLNAEQHSAYIARALDLPSVEPWEQELIAQLCQSLPPDRALPKPRRVAGEPPIHKLLGLLRVLDGLSGPVDQRVALKAVSLRGRSLKLILSKRLASGLEPIQVDLRKALLESTLRVRVTAELR